MKKVIAIVTVILMLSLTQTQAGAQREDITTIMGKASKFNFADTIPPKDTVVKEVYIRERTDTLATEVYVKGVDGIVHWFTGIDLIRYSYKDDGKEKTALDVKVLSRMSYAFVNTTGKKDGVRLVYIEPSMIYEVRERTVAPKQPATDTVKSKPITPVKKK